MLQIFKQEKSELFKLLIYINFSTLKWKQSVDGTVQFLDGGKIPCLLIENKLDLVDEQNLNNPGLEEFEKNREFCGSFKTSAKTGVNIAESMEYLIHY